MGTDAAASSLKVVKMLRFADFCAGIGGFRLGLEKIGWTCVYSCEIDDNCEATYHLNFGDRFRAKDIFNLNPDNLPDFEIFCAGFPCQPFSIAGKRLGLQDPRGVVLLQLLRIIGIKKPPILILENVANFVSHNDGITFRTLLQQLNLIGYDIHYKILDSAFFGVPQHRKRVYILGFLREVHSSLFFSITNARTRKIPFKHFIAQGDYSIPISAKWERYIDLYTNKITVNDIEFDLPKTRIAIESANKGVNLEDCVLQMRSSGIRACSIDAPLPTFAVSNSGGGAMIPVYTKERRHLSLLEIKRIMGFPDDFKFSVSRTHAIKQLANAVCPSVIFSIGSDIKEFLAHANL